MLETSDVEGRGDGSIMMRDEDGSLTGQAGSTVVKPDMYFTRNSDCALKEGWNLEVCQDKYAKVSSKDLDPFVLLQFPFSTVLSVAHGRRDIRNIHH